MSAIRASAESDVGADHTVSWAGSSDLPEALRDRLRARGVLVTTTSGLAAPVSRLAAVDARRDAATDGSNLAGRRVLVLHSDAEHASLLTWALSARGAMARALAGNASELDEVALLDADVVLVDEGEFFGNCWASVCSVWRHTRLRWTPVLILPLNFLESGSDLELDALCASVQGLCESYERCVRRAAEKTAFDLSLGVLGPARTLRALLEAGASLRVRVATERVKIHVDVADHIVLGARGGFSDGASIELNGARALSCLLGEETGVAHVCPIEGSALSNIMATLETALPREAPSAATPGRPDDATSVCPDDAPTVIASASGDNGEDSALVEFLKNRGASGTNISGVRKIEPRSPSEAPAELPNDAAEGVLGAGPELAADAQANELVEPHYAGPRFLRVTLWLLALVLVGMSATTLWRETRGSDADARTIVDYVVQYASRLVGAGDEPPR